MGFSLNVLLVLTLFCCCYVFVDCKSTPWGPNAEKGRSKNSTLVCQGEKKWITCKPGYHVEVVNAFWGRDDQTTCPTNPPGLLVTKMCHTDDKKTTKIVKQICTDKRYQREARICEIHAIPAVFDPLEVWKQQCGDVFMYINVWYKCVLDKKPSSDEGKKIRKRKNKLQKRKKSSPNGNNELQL